MECPVCKKEFTEHTGRRPKKFCSDKCKVKYFNTLKKATAKEAPKTDKNGDVITRKTLATATTEMLWGGKTTVKIPLPRTLEELKKLCPPHLTGFEKSQWVATERQKYGI